MVLVLKLGGFDYMEDGGKNVVRVCELHVDNAHVHVNYQ